MLSNIAIDLKKTTFTLQTIKHFQPFKPFSHVRSPILQPFQKRQRFPIRRQARPEKLIYRSVRSHRLALNSCISRTVWRVLFFVFQLTEIPSGEMPCKSAAPSLQTINFGWKPKHPILPFNAAAGSVGFQPTFSNPFYNGNPSIHAPTPCSLLHAPCFFPYTSKHSLSEYSFLSLDAKNR